MDERIVIALATAEPVALRARQVVDALKNGELQKLAPLMEDLEDGLGELREEIADLNVGFGSNEDAA